MKAEEFLRDKFDEHWKNGGSALNISAYAESKILIWMDEYKQLHQPTVISTACDCENKVYDPLMSGEVKCLRCGKMIAQTDL